MNNRNKHNGMNADRIFFPAMAVYFIFLSLLGFSGSFYASEDAIKLPFSIQLHGILYTIWLLYFFLQTLFIGFRLRRTHMLLGKLSIVLFISLLISGIYVTLLNLEKNGAFLFAEQVSIFLLLGSFYTLSLMKRKKPAEHKRYMTFAVISMMAPAVYRIQWLEINQHLWAINLLLYFPVVAIILFDFISIRKLNIATYAGTLLIALITIIVRLADETQWWNDLTNHIINLINMYNY